MSKTIKQNLFRFVTLRNPQLIENKKDHKGFIFNPYEEESVFFTAINGAKEDEKQVLLQDKARVFNAMKTRKDVRVYNEGLYQFSAWLMRNKNHLSYSAIRENIGEATSFDSRTSEDSIFWENLIYQTITQESVYVREAIIQMLVANEFLKAFNTFRAPLHNDVIFTQDQEQDFVRRANASVVLSKALFSNSIVSGGDTRKASALDIKKLENLSDVAVAKYENAAYKTLIKELEKVEIKYNKDNQKAYRAALDNHNEVVERLVAEAKPVIVNETDLKTGETTSITTYPDLNLPKFEFVKPNTIDNNYLEPKLENNSLALFKAECLDVHDDFKEVYQDLNSKIKSNNKIIFNKKPKAAKKVRIGGVNLRIADKAIPYLDYNVSNFMQANPSGLSSPFIILYNVVDALQIQSMTYTINHTDGTTDSGTNYVIEPSSGSMIKLFPSGTQFPTSFETYTISGEITLLSGETYSFTQLVDRKQRFNMGRFELVDASVETSEEKIYGVTKLGIADFRRVEQEVCCYVPGEVSHIENIMAREYKERATRSLTSVETTSETTTERETENLTDTTTTDRNEMQSEVAAVINEDNAQNYGASASASYQPTNNSSINIGGYADFSSSSSSSNSNSQAQTYAQEVTERAMERIVQKTNKKRTSRILKEFEENNKHGFDNTKGAEHVTGVYRWVDKIYKNKLINYGKRLMYEFAIPEPAKFLKDALLKEANEGTLESGLILPEAPVHPSQSATPINSPADLTAMNYQIIASYYNAIVTAKPEENITIGKGFAVAGQEVTSLFFSKEDTITIPDGYIATDAKAYLSGMEYPLSGRGISVAIGDIDFKEFGTIPGRATDFDYAPFIFPFKEALPVSVYFCNYHTGNVNVSAKCKLSDEAKEQWKNETYNAIMDAYNDRVEEYNAQIALNHSQEEESITFNPLHNRSLEKKELKRIAIELISKPKGHEVSANNYDSSTIEKVNRGEAFETHAATVKFFEQAFDWEIMAYTFYPYFYGQEGDWKDLFQMQDAADPLFQAFLQSGMARTIVPVRPGFEDAVNWYMTTGEIWNGQGLVTDQDDDLYVSIAEEMQTVEGEVEGTWETRLPTSLTVIQAGSIGLNVEGLPCNSDCEDFKLFDSDGQEILDENGQSFSNPIEQTNTLIGGVETTTATTEPQTGGIKQPLPTK